ncbi:MAG: ABC transporter ATP-binding protein [Clostridia bacterium]|nr:ABC transporter ATP-binding protein [Clostridia bacterium]
MKKQILKKLNELAPVSGFLRVLYIACVAVQSALTVIFALCVKNLINSVEKGGDMLDPNSVSKWQLWLVVLISVVAFMCVLGAISSLLGDKLTVSAEKALKTKLIKGLFLSSYDSIVSHSEGDIISRLEGDVSVVSGVRVNLLPAIISTAIRLVGTLIAMLYLDLYFTLIVLACALIFVVGSIFVRKIAGILHKNVRSKNADNISLINESLSLAPVVKAFGYENYILDKASQTFNLYKNAKLKQRYFSTFINTVVNVLFTAFYVAVAIYGVYGIKTGNESMSFGLITAMLQLVLQVKSPVTGISRFFTSHAEMLASAQRLFEVLKATETATEIKGFKSLTLKGVSFSYGNGEVLSGVNLTVNKGDKVLIKGASGAGKSTLIKVILSLHPTSSGLVTVKGENGETTNKTKGTFAFVPQESRLFSATIKENILLGEEYNEQRFLSAIKNARLDGVISELENKENTVIGTSFNLSEGQAQRLSVARALYSGAPVIVLDEPTSHLDGVSEEALFKSLSALEGITVIMVSHKKESENYATAVYTLENGTLN